jgi:hypothetical protein
VCAELITGEREKFVDVRFMGSKNRSENGRFLDFREFLMGKEKWDSLFANPN